MRLGVIVCLAWLAAGSAAGQERYARTISERAGMPPGVLSMTQDESGLLWIGSERGLYRYDGRHVERRGGPEAVRIGFLRRGDDGRVLAGESPGRLWDVSGAEWIQLREAAWNAAATADGRLWVTLADRPVIATRARTGDWREIAPEALEGEAPLQLVPDGRDGILVSTFEGSLFRVASDGTATALVRGLGGRISHLAVGSDGTIALSVRFGPRPGVYLLGDGELRRLVDRDARYTGLAFRGSSVWVLSDRGSWVVRKEGSVEFIDPDRGPFGGGSLFIDEEGALWHFGAREFYQFPEPDTLLWTRDQGGVEAVRRLHRAEGSVWAATWDGLRRFDPEQGTWVAAGPPGYRVWDRGRVDPWGRLWFVGVPRVPYPPDRFVLFSTDGEDFVPWLEASPSGPPSAVRFAEGPGPFWIVFGGRLYRVDSQASAPEPVADLPDGTDAVGLAVDTDGGVDLGTRSGEICSARLPASIWSCRRIPGVEELYDLHLFSDGSLWAATRPSGVLRRHADAWSEVQGLGVPDPVGFHPSPRGGVWVVGHVDRLRVRREGAEARPVERLTPASGVPAWPAESLLEDSDGTVWLATFPGVVQIPANARDRLPEPPRVQFTEFKVNGKAGGLDGTPRLEYGTQTVELRAAAATYLDTGALRYRMRTRPGSAWSETTEPTFRFVDLNPGRYRVQVAASRDGVRWNRTPVEFGFVVLGPWYLQPWAWLLAASAVAAVAYTAHRLRLAHVRRLEHQRMAIAMDLHDELGAGLGSIGLLARLGSEEAIDPAERRALAGRVEEIAAELGRSVSDIVWSLRSDAGTLEDLVLFLRDRCSDLFAAGETRVRFDVPSPCPHVPLDLPVRRNVQAIAAEALNNVAKHAHARRLVVGLRGEREEWELSVDDDGVGLDPRADPGAGLGLESGRRRAAQIGAELTRSSGPNGGTRIVLRFRARSR